MANWYYYDSSNQRQGLITDAELKYLSAQGIITPETESFERCLTL
ncbi:MAG: DUF4339 domain-containing protein [Planctomycetaceae bacterium]|nr:DUF4339 domain-containing protein [Planctomycetaceae bacterium]